MRAARSFGRDDVRIEELAEPVAGEEEVVCDVLACGVCATDVIDWYVAPRLPAVLGHEVVGVVRASGSGVRPGTPAPGTRVAIHHHAPCGECRRCRRGHETMCERFRSTRLDPGGFAERVRVPSELVGDLLELPDSLDPLVAVFIEPLACVLRAQRRTGLRPGDSLLVVGAGVSGLLQIAAARAQLVEAVWVREPRSQRLALAQSWGAERHGNEPVDVAIVCTPNPDAIAAALGALAPGGTLCLYAPPAPGGPSPLDGSELFLRELSVTASYSAGRTDLVEALELLVSGRVDPRSLVTHTLPLEQTAGALALQRSGEALKPVVLPRSA